MKAAKLINDDEYAFLQGDAVKELLSLEKAIMASTASNVRESMRGDRALSLSSVAITAKGGFSGAEGVSLLNSPDCSAITSAGGRSELANSESELVNRDGQTTTTGSFSSDRFSRSTITRSSKKLKTPRPSRPTTSRDSCAEAT